MFFGGVYIFIGLFNFLVFELYIVCVFESVICFIDYLVMIFNEMCVVFCIFLNGVILVFIVVICMGIIRNIDVIIEVIGVNGGDCVGMLLSINYIGFDYINVFDLVNGSYIFMGIVMLDGIQIYIV